MAVNDFSAESPENFEQKCLCVLVLDVSGSMSRSIGSGTLINQLNEGLLAYKSDIESNPTTSQRLETAILTFNNEVETIQEPALIEHIEMPTLEAKGSTAMGDALRAAIDKVEARKAWYRQTGQSYYRPWIIMITDGVPDSGQDMEGVATQIKQDMQDKKYVFLPLGVEGADMNMLNSLCGELPGGKRMGAMPLNAQKFSEFFEWLSASLGTVVSTGEGQTVGFEAPTWMDGFTI